MSAPSPPSSRRAVLIRRRLARGSLVGVGHGSIERTGQESERCEDAQDCKNERPYAPRQRQQHDREHDDRERDHAHDEHGGVASRFCGAVEVKEGIALHGGFHACVGAGSRPYVVTLIPGPRVPFEPRGMEAHTHTWGGGRAR